MNFYPHSFSTQKLQQLQHQVEKLKEENFTIETCKYSHKTVIFCYLKLQKIPPVLVAKDQ